MPALSFGKVPFAEQIAFFRQKLNLPTRGWRDIERNAHDRAFVVAGAMKSDLLADLRAGIDAAIANGETLESFRKRFDATVARNGWDYRGPRNWRTRVIYQTNLATSYAGGRLVQLQQAAADGLLWMYRHSDTVITPRPLHVSWDGLALPASDPWWRTHYPPNGWGCRCYVVGVRRELVERRGGRLGPAPDDGTDPATGAPAGIDEGWDYMPGARAAEPLSNLVRDKLVSWDAGIGSSAFAEMSEAIVPALTREFADWADALTQAKGEVRVVGALSPTVVQQLAARGIAPSSAHLAVRDKDVLHAHRDSKDNPLPWSWYRVLPGHLTTPAAVLLDKSKAAETGLLYVFDVGGETGKVVVRLDYQVGLREPGQAKVQVPFNVLITGSVIDPQALKNPVAYEILEGAL